jgi:cyclophilin family peptidyl-prolyl cis-trans isomerase
MTGETPPPPESTEPKRRDVSPWVWVVMGGILLIIVAGAIPILLAADDDDEDVVVDGPEQTLAPEETEAPEETQAPEETAPPIDVPASCDQTEPELSEPTVMPGEPEMQIDPARTYTATIRTSCGDMVVALDAANAPVGVNNFVALARAGFYDNTTFHRVVPDFVIQGGDPEGTGAGGPGYSVVTELPADGYQTGELAWAKTQADAPGTAGSQFFVVTGAEDGQGVGFLNDTSTGSYLYGAFGMITEGLEVAQTIESLSTGDGPPAIPVYVYGVDITEA